MSGCNLTSKGKGTLTVLPNGKFIDQHPDALRLTLIEGDFDRSALTSLASHSDTVRGVGIDATVIGASHLITYKFGNLTLSEVFACVELDDVPSWRLTDLEQMTVQRKFSGICYEFGVSRLSWCDPEPGILTNLVAEACANATDPGAVGVMYEFPAGECLTTPKTVIVGSSHVCRNGVSITTAHSYPNVQQLVLSHSAFYFD